MSILIATCALAGLCSLPLQAHDSEPLASPFVGATPVLDGDLSEWESFAFLEVTSENGVFDKSRARWSSARADTQSEAGRGLDSRAPVGCLGTAGHRSNTRRTHSYARSSAARSVANASQSTRRARRFARCGIRLLEVFFQCIGKGI